MIKQFIGTIVLLLLISFAMAQDVIIKHNGQKIECTVVEVSDQIIKCKHFSTPDKTVFNILTKDVYMIKYQNGEEIVFNYKHPEELIFNIEPLSVQNGFWGKRIWMGDTKMRNADIKTLFGSYPEALKKFNAGNTMKIAGNLIGLPSAFAFGWNLGIMIAGGEANNTVLAISGVGTVMGIVLVVFGNNSVMESVNIYNSAIEGTSLNSIKLGITENGIGLKLGF